MAAFCCQFILFSYSNFLNLLLLYLAALVTIQAFRLSGNITGLLKRLHCKNRSLMLSMCYCFENILQPLFLCSCQTINMRVLTSYVWIPIIFVFLSINSRVCSAGFCLFFWSSEERYRAWAKLRNQTVRIYMSTTNGSNDFFYLSLSA